jgi:hypothetical protein
MPTTRVLLSSSPPSRGYSLTLNRYLQQTQHLSSLHECLGAPPRFPPRTVAEEVEERYHCVLSRTRHDTANYYLGQHAARHAMVLPGLARWRPEAVISATPRLSEAGICGDCAMSNSFRVSPVAGARPSCAARSRGVPGLLPQGLEQGFRVIPGAGGSVGWFLQPAR